MNEGHDGTKLGQWVPLPNPDGYKPNRTLEINDKYHLQMQQQMQPSEQQACQRRTTIQAECIRELAVEAFIVANGIKGRLYGPEPQAPEKCVESKGEGLQHELDRIENYMEQLLKTLHSISERL